MLINYGIERDYYLLSLFVYEKMNIASRYMNYIISQSP